MKIQEIPSIITEVCITEPERGKVIYWIILESKKGGVSWEKRYWWLTTNWK